ncbi:MAG: serine--tRNA ligase, partial [Thermoleophilia bacterium]|nr:serine--tRNA ligase [Thermoleophilia bacterium]
MLDIRLIRETPEVVEETLQRRGATADLSKVRELDEQRRAVNTKLDDLRAERNSASKSIGAAKGRGEDAEAEMAAVRELGDRMDAATERERALAGKLDTMMLNIPNIVQDD